jgi:hypothetical protein
VRPGAREARYGVILKQRISSRREVRFPSSRRTNYQNHKAESGLLSQRSEVAGIRRDAEAALNLRANETLAKNHLEDQLAVATATGLNRTPCA